MTLVVRVFAALALSVLSQVAVSAALTAEQALKHYHEVTASVAPRCGARKSEDEIIVCAENPLKYRLPPREPEPGNPRDESVVAERERLMREPPVKCGLGAFLTGCGAVGIGHTSRF